MTSKFKIRDIVRFLMSRGVRYRDAVRAWELTELYGTAAVQINALVTYEFAEDYDDTGVIGYDVRIQNALI